jgi:TolB protein
MNNQLKHKILFGVFAMASVCILIAASPPKAYGKIYIDVTSPRQQVIVAVSLLEGPHGEEISDIIRDDLGYTGFFVPIERAAFIEKPGQTFMPDNWSVLGAELVIKGHVRQTGEGLSVVVTVYDVFDGRKLLKKLYRAEEALIRPLSHSISNDIYKAVTGQDGVFRTKIAFVARNDNEHSLYLMDWDGKRAKPLGIKSSLIMTPHWSDEGRRLLYSAERHRRWGIYILDFDEGVERTVFRERATNIAGDFFPGGREFVLSSSLDGTPDIYIYNLKNKKLRRVTSLKGIAVSPSVSPDGSKIAFVSDRGGNPQIYTTDKIGYNMNRITYNGSYNTSPSWSPKGDRLAFSGRFEGKNQIFIVKPDGSGLQMLTDAGNNEDPSFSPDGRFIVFTSDRDGKKGIYLMRSNGEAQKRITPWALDAFGPGWSPE